MSYNFYKALNYPIPNNKEFFSYKPVTSLKQEVKQIKWNNKFSRKEKNEYIDEYIKHIEWYKRLRRNLPWVKAIYLCNSITFNALHKESDIDLFIITEKNRIRRTRFRSIIFMTITWARRWWSSVRKKFCLSFYVTEDNLNFHSLRLKDGDVYLPYWIAHLVPLYKTKNFDTNKIYRKNKRILYYISNLPLTQNIFLDISLSTGKSFIKKLLSPERDNHFISWLNNLIGNLRKTIILWKAKKQWTNTRHIIANNDILKFHKDKRRQYYFLFKKQRRSQR